jgi:hypothetical protein
MNPVTSQDTRWTWLQMTWGPKRQRASLQGLNQKTAKLAWQGFKPKPWRKRRQRPRCKCTQIRDHARSNRGANRGRTRPKRAWAVRPGPSGLGRPAQPTPGPVRAPFCPRCLSIYCLCLRCRHIHPSTGTRRNLGGSDDGRRKSSKSSRRWTRPALAAMAALHGWAMAEFRS